MYLIDWLSLYQIILSIYIHKVVIDIVTNSTKTYKIFDYFSVSSSSSSYQMLFSDSFIFSFSFQQDQPQYETINSILNNE